MQVAERLANVAQSFRDLGAVHFFFREWRFDMNFRRLYPDEIVSFSPGLPRIAATLGW